MYTLCPRYRFRRGPENHTSHRQERANQREDATPIWFKPLLFVAGHGQLLVVPN
jgi:hypothetical protein